MKIKDNFLDKVKRDIKMYSGWVKDTKELLTMKNDLVFIPEELDEFEEGSYWSDSDLTIEIPWNPKLCDKVCNLLQDYDWFSTGDYKSGRAGAKPEYYIYYHHKETKIKITVKMSSSDKNSTCKLVQVGTETVEKPIWQVQCAEEFTVEDL